MTRALSVEAQPEELPEILVSPPWSRKRAKPTVIEVARVHRAAALEWEPGEQEGWANIASVYDNADEQVWRRWIDKVVVQPGYTTIRVLADAPVELARPHLDRLGATPFVNARYRFLMADEGGPGLEPPDPHRKLLGRFGADVLGWAMETADAQPWVGAPIWAPIIGSDVTAMMVDWLDKSQGAIARSWFCRHSFAAALDLIPAAVGKAVKDRREATFVLRLLDKRGHRRTIMSAADSYGADVVTAVLEILDGDRLLWLPTRVPKAPDWLDPAALPRIRLRHSMKVLPDSAVVHLIAMLMMCEPDSDYAGVAVAAEELDVVSAGEFVWAIYRAWQSAKYPGKKNPWALRALGLLGDDATLMRLRRIAESDRAVNRALEALDTLTLVGTRNAHTHIQRIRENTQWPAVRTQAAEAIAKIVAELGITMAEFTDRAVADLGLSPDGTLRLDYGPRQFVIGLDERLKVVVREADGKVRATLPKPAAADDQALASAAYSRFGSFKKLVQEAITDESARLEQAMVSERRWRADKQRELIIEHPLLGQLARRLVWATFGADGQVTGTFRVDADGSLADVEDELVELAGDALVGVAHPLHLGGVLGAWGEVFADYQLLQPFSQLDRVSFDAGSEGMKAGLTPFWGRTVPTGKLLGLPKLGWVKGYGSGGVNEHFTRTQPGGNRVWVTFSPGINGRNPMEIPEQTLDNIGTELDLEQMSPIVASELLRELHTLAV